MTMGFFRWFATQIKNAFLTGVQEAMAELDSVEPGEAVVLRLEIVKPQLAAPKKGGK